jgi:NAD+ synthase
MKTITQNQALTIPNIDVYIETLCQRLKDDVFHKLRRRGAVIGISGGIDSSVTFALAVKALGAKNVLGVMMPEKDSSKDSLTFAQTLADRFGAEAIIEDITDALAGFGCYTRRDEAVKHVFQNYEPTKHSFKIGMKESAIETKLPSPFYITLVDEKGQQESKTLPAKAFLQIMGASNFKQRTRMSMLYYHAERLYYSVIGTPNKHEINQGFFVKHGDGGADVMPIGHLYKTQVYQLAKALDVPREIIERTPTTDTYSAEQTQEEFFFQLPFDQMDLLWHAYEHNQSPALVAELVGKSEEAVENIFHSFKRKQTTTDYLRMSPIVYHDLNQ